MNNLLKPKIDVVFHALFREENNHITEAFISDVLGQKIKIKSNLDRHLDIKSSNEKFGIMDLHTILEDGYICNIEIQLDHHAYESERFLYYLANAYSRQLASGEPYSKIQKTISIIILDHELPVLSDCEKLNIKWHMRDDDTGKRLLTDKFEMVIMELPKAKKIYSKSPNRICEWLLFLDNPNDKEVSEIMDKNKDIKEAVNKLEYVSGDYEIRRIAELKEKAKKDERTIIESAVEKGLEQGLQQGLQQGHKESCMKIAKKMLKENINIDIIVRTTGVCKEDLLKLK